MTVPWFELVQWVIEMIQECRQNEKNVILAEVRRMRPMKMRRIDRRLRWHFKMTRADWRALPQRQTMMSEIATAVTNATEVDLYDLIEEALEE